MDWARRSWQPWVLRLAAFVLFISGGALAQRYLSSEAAIQSLPLEPGQKAQVAVVLVDTRKLEVIPSFAPDAAPIQITPFLPHLEPRVWDHAANPSNVIVRLPRTFDAQAPPTAL
jgi:hypothetical protein